MIILRHTTTGRTPLDEWSARRRDLYLTTQNTHRRQNIHAPVGFEPATPANERSQTHALDRAAIGFGKNNGGQLLLWPPPPQVTLMAVFTVTIISNVWQNSETPNVTAGGSQTCYWASSGHNGVSCGIFCNPSCVISYETVTLNKVSNSPYLFAYNNNECIGFDCR